MPQAEILSGMHDKHLSHNVVSNIVTVFDESGRVALEMKQWGVIGSFWLFAMKASDKQHNWIDSAVWSW
jgi:hypothetical protein